MDLPLPMSAGPSQSHDDMCSLTPLAMERVEAGGGNPGLARLSLLSAAMHRNSINCSAMASPKPAATLADDEELLGFYEDADGETALTGAKRGFANLDDGNGAESHPTKKVCASHEISSNLATTTILNLRSSLKDRDDTISGLKASLYAAKGELEKWTSGFTNDSVLSAGATAGPAVTVQALQKLQASERELKEQLLTAKRRETHMFMTLSTTAQEVVDLKRKLEAAEKKIKHLVPDPAPDLQQQPVFEERAAPEAAVPDISYPPRDPPPISQQTQNLEGQDRPPLEPPPLEPVIRPQDGWEVQPRRPREPTESEKQRAAERARSFQSSNPFIMATMRPSQVYNGFSICLRSNALPIETEDATLLDGTGKSWICKWLVNVSGKRLSAGWKRFALDHELEENDVLVFEVVSREVLTLLVHIFRVELDDSTVGAEEKLQYYDGVSPFRKKKRIRPSRAKVRNTFFGGSPLNLPEGVATPNTTTTHSEGQPENEANVLPGAASQRTPSSVSPHSQSRSVNMEGRRRAELAARALKTANPSVMVVLTKSSVQYHFCLTIPCAFAKQWLPQALVPVTLCDSAGRRAPARWAGNCKSAHLKGFKTFALTHALEEGDVLVLELVDSSPDKLVFLVHMFRACEDLNHGFSSQDFVDKSENGCEASKSQSPKRDSNVAAEFSAATPSYTKGFCVDVLPLAMRMPEQRKVFQKPFVPPGGGPP